MDAYFPHADTAAAVKQWNQKLVACDGLPDKSEFSMHAADLDMQRVGTFMNPDGRGARIVFPGDRTPRKIVFTVARVLINKDLPLVNTATAKAVPPKLLRQRATVAGYQTALFRKSINNLEQVCYEMSRIFAMDELVPWSPVIPTEKYRSTLRSSCRYFTLRANIPEDLKVEFEPSCDPHGMLCSLQNDVGSGLLCTHGQLVSS
ncbi:hypothetical protein MSAN_00359100 [Mycena sanguinolenta]|uniref:Uncharacterized protein n=1 Tax=Mycena sanguinolenta TaxID=230812 RepID=A0A8H6ZED3_9AGAR|nr:hypothetical protein MSAN_00359100 [Mycena sanguinolenta]